MDVSFSSVENKVWKTFARKELLAVLRLLENAKESRLYIFVNHE